MLKVTTRMPRSTWASPSVSRACSQGRWRRRWVRPRVLGRLVSERLESLGEGIMPAARLPTPRAAPPGTWEHLRGAQGPVLPPLHPTRSRAHPLAGSPGAWLRASSWRRGQGRGVTEGPRSAPSPPRAPDGHRAQDGDEGAGTQAHRISLGKRGAEKGRSGGEERERGGDGGREPRQRMGKVNPGGWGRRLGEREGAAAVPPACPVGSKAGRWARPRHRCLQSPARLPSHHAPLPHLRLQWVGRQGVGMGWCERRSVAARCTPGVVVSTGDPSGWAGAGHRAGRQAGRQGCGEGKCSPVPASPGTQARASNPLGARLSPTQPLSAPQPPPHCVLSRGSGSFRAINGRMGSRAPR